MNQPTDDSKDSAAPEGTETVAAEETAQETAAADAGESGTAPAPEAEAEPVETRSAQPQPESPAPEPQKTDSRKTEPPAPAPKVIEKTVVERKGGFVPMLLGGVVAAGAGFGLAQYFQGSLPAFLQLPPNPTLQQAQDDLSSTTDRLNTVAGLVDANSGQVEGALEQIAGAQTQLGDTSDLLGATRSELEETRAALAEARGGLDDALSQIVELHQELADTRAALQQTQDETARQNAAVADLEARLAEADMALETRLATAEGTLAGIDLTPLASGITELSDVSDDLGSRQLALNERFFDLDARMTAVEKAPLADIVPPETIAAYERELTAFREQLQTQSDDLAARTDATVTAYESAFNQLRDEVQAQTQAMSVSTQETIATNQATLEALQAEVAAQTAALEARVAAQTAEIETSTAEAVATYEAALAALRGEVEAMMNTAVEAEEVAEEQATLAQSRVALAELTPLVQSGEAYAEPLSVLTDNGVTIPDALSGFADTGIPSLSALAETFPDFARDALDAVRTTATEEDGAAQSGGFGSFLQSRLGARSVVPREGNDPDAVLSRAEAAVRGGDIDTVLMELDALPEMARAPLEPWIAEAMVRQQALAAVSALGQDLNQQ